ncbi:MAG: Na+/H+ antiporter subunit E [Rheinheimera sp.]|jgi:multicomponent K+:H+ antiporter subunit E
MNTSLFHKWFPTPVRSLLLFCVWILLNNSIEPIHLLAALILAIGIPLLTVGFRDTQPAIKNWPKAASYLLMVLWDIVIANLQVLKVILGPNKNMKPGFVMVPVDMVESLPITILAGTVSLTPGTVSADVLKAKNARLENPTSPYYIIIHVLNLDDEQALIDSIKQRYEARLKEIFQC